MKNKIGAIIFIGCILFCFADIKSKFNHSFEYDSVTRRVKVLRIEAFRDVLTSVYTSLPSEYKAVADPQNLLATDMLNAIDSYLASLISPFSDYKDGLLEKIIISNSGLTPDNLKEAIDCLVNVYTEIKSMSTLSDEDLKAEFENIGDNEFKGIAIAYETLRRVSEKEFWDAKLNNETKIPPIIKLHSEQVLAAYFGSPAHEKIIDFKTGEGKTEAEFVISVLTVGVHGLKALCVTHNEPLKIQTISRLQGYYDFLGLKMGELDGMQDSTKDVSNYDVVWTEWSQPIYWYEHGVRVSSVQIGKSLANYFMIVDEADAVLIEQASSPCIISQSSGNKLNSKLQTVYISVAEAVRDGLITRDTESVNNWLNENGQRFIGVADAEQLVGIIYNALAAKDMRQDVHYFVRDDRKGITLIEHISGAPAESKKFMNGMHQAVEAKEIVAGNMQPGMISTESNTLIAYTLSSFINKLAGFTALSGTAKIWSEAFDSVWNKDTIAIPPHSESGRTDYEIACKDSQTQAQIVRALMDEANKANRPVALVFKDMERLQEFKEIMESQGLNAEELKYLTPRELVELNSDKLNSLKNMLGEEGVLTFATMVFGRGWDVKSSEPLRIIMVDYQPSYVREQTRGRTGRQGAEGDTFWVYQMNEITDAVGGDISFREGSNYMIRQGRSDQTFLSWLWGKTIGVGTINGEEAVPGDIQNAISKAIEIKDENALSQAVSRLTGTINRYHPNDIAVDAVYKITNQIRTQDGFNSLLDIISSVAAEEERPLIDRIKQYSIAKDDINFRFILIQAPLIASIEESAKLDMWDQLSAKEFSQDVVYGIIGKTIMERILDFWNANKGFIDNKLRKAGI